jgi:hypothetical protein
MSFFENDAKMWCHVIVAQEEQKYQPQQNPDDDKNSTNRKTI